MHRYMYCWNAFALGGKEGGYWGYCGGVGGSSGGRGCMSGGEGSELQ